MLVSSLLRGWAGLSQYGKSSAQHGLKRWISVIMISVTSNSHAVSTTGTRSGVTIAFHHGKRNPIPRKNWVGVRSLRSLHINSQPHTVAAPLGLWLVHLDLRSILMSRACTTLFVGYNPSAAKPLSLFNIRGLPAYDHLPNFIQTRDKDSPSNVSNLLSNCFTLPYESAKRAIDTEKQLERAIVSNLSKQLNQIVKHNEKEMAFTVRNEVSLGNSAGTADLVFLENRTESSVPLGLVEVGLLSSDQKKNDHRVEEKLDRLFWVKAGQGLQYVNMIYGDNKWKWTNPLLLGVLVATRDCKKGRVAIFLCEPKENKSGWRKALLWRSAFESRDELSAAFGYYVNGLTYLAKEKTNLANDESIVWEYLGPNCAKVAVGTGEEYVLRSYDNRVRQTDRTPCLYKSWYKLKELTKPVLIVKDNEFERDTIDFAVPLDDIPETNDRSLLFYKWNKPHKKGGKVEVIAAPYIEGGHRCMNIDQALFLAKYLRELHENGFVHGDIRGLNIVFKKDSNEAYFIDWDFGGHIHNDKRVYPLGYQDFLPDGVRNGQATNPITPEDDAEALACILGRMHEPIKDSGELWSLQKLMRNATDINVVVKTLEKMKKLGVTSMQTDALYEKFLRKLALEKAVARRRMGIRDPQTR